MLSLRRLLQLPRGLTRAGKIRSEPIDVVLENDHRIAVLRVRDPRARRIKLTVDERGARLTLPPRASLAAGDRFLWENADWLRHQFDLQTAASGAPLQRNVTTALPLRGIEIPLRWDAGRTSRLAPSDDGQLLFVAPAQAGPAALRRALLDFYAAQARADIGRWLPGHLPNLPRAPRRIVFKRPRSQWGSLAPDDTLTLDLALILVHPDAFHYVLVHELCHLLHRDHSPRFWAEVETRLPDWRHQRAHLQAVGRGPKARLRQLLAG